MQAQAWDNDPMKVERAAIFAKEINDFIQPKGALSALEFGCGTGLLSFQLKDYFKTITLADNSEGMIKVLRAKIKAAGIENFKPLLIDLLKEELEGPKHDVVYTLMTLHHIPDVDAIIKVFSTILESKGYLCIADIVKEDGSFHASFPDFDGHNGFERGELNTILAKNGFKPVYYNEPFEIEKKVNDELIKFPVFLMICRKDT